MRTIKSPKAKAAFDLSREPQKLRDRYGRDVFGQSALLARRLVERGAGFVTVTTNFVWDMHADQNNAHMTEGMSYMAPPLDHAVSAFLDDLRDRGLEDKVLLVACGEMGRTPRINASVGSQTGIMQPGRDHWPNAMSVLVAGGGMRTGQVIGQTNSRGEEPRDRPLTPNDLWASVYRHLGIDYHHSFPDLAGRPMPILPYGEPIADCLPVHG